MGADLKNTVTLVVDGQAFVSQHIGDLDHYQAFRRFRRPSAIWSRCMRFDWDDCWWCHDAHPQYRSTAHALDLPAARKIAVQHHRAHIASVLAERGAGTKRCSESVSTAPATAMTAASGAARSSWAASREGFERVAHLRPRALPGGDAAAQYPVQAAAGFLAQMDGLPDLTPRRLPSPARYQTA